MLISRVSALLNIHLVISDYFYRSIFFSMKHILLALSVLMSYVAFSQTKNIPSSLSKPKLVIGIVVDQMRWDYLYRYAEKYGQTGFKRLQKGYNCENTHIPYVPTYTGPGHTCIYTGSVPAIHGIIGNEWYDRESRSIVSCVGDTNFKTIGANGKEGKVSPNRMLTTTITDELRLATNFRSRVISIAAKDRSAILPAGHAANAAYCFDGESGNWVTSSYYMDSLPQWAINFNAKKSAVKYITDHWQTILALKDYTESTDDDAPFEKRFGAEDKPIFPHLSPVNIVQNPGTILYTPWGNTLTFDFAKSAIVGEHLGKGAFTDFLALSFSSTDYIGHQFGPNSVEAEDCYIRFDRDLGDFLSYLDKEIGAGNYIIFLTADHGASHAVGFNREHHIPAGVLTGDTLKKKCNEFLKAQYGKDSLIEMFYNMQIYLHRDNLKRYALNEDVIKKDLINYLISISGVAKAIDLSTAKTTSLPASYLDIFINGYNQKRSGDIQLVLEPAYMEGYLKGTTHGSAYSYDTHIPLLWYGWGIKPGYDHSQTYMTDIAATLATLLHIQEPNGCVGKPIIGLVK